MHTENGRGLRPFWCEARSHASYTIHPNLSHGPVQTKRSKVFHVDTVLRYYTEEYQPKMER